MMTATLIPAGGTRLKMMIRHQQRRWNICSIRPLVQRHVQYALILCLRLTGVYATFQPSSIPDSLTFSPSRAPRIEPAPSSSPVYVIIFGYPLDKYSVTVEYFKSFGPSADPEPNTEIVNCFRIGYRDASDAMRAVKRNGEVLKGTYMIGVKWAVRCDPDVNIRLTSPFLRIRQQLQTSFRQHDLSWPSRRHHPSNPIPWTYHRSLHLAHPSILHRLVRPSGSRVLLARKSLGWLYLLLVP